MTTNEPVLADPGDLAEQSTPVDADVETQELGEPPIETDSADYVEQHQAVDYPADEDYPAQ